ncbi:MAG: hypothetical protein ACK5KP_06705 [Paludibacteraceae bacterium]
MHKIAEKNSRWDMGVGASSLSAKSNYSAYGAHYRANYTSGLQINSKLLYSLKDNTNFGLKYNLFSSGANYVLQDNQAVVENLLVNYIAPQLGYEYILSPKVSFLQTVGLGYAHYQSKGLKADNEYNAVNANLLGGNADLALYYNLSSKTSIGFLTSVIVSIYSKEAPILTGNNDSKWNKLNLSRFDFSLNYRVTF